MKTIEMVERIKSENIRKKLTFEQKYDEGLKEVTEEIRKKINDEDEIKFFNAFMKEQLKLTSQKQHFNYYKELNNYLAKNGVEKTREMLQRIYDESDVMKEDLSKKMNENNIGLENKYSDMYHNPLANKMSELLIPIKIINGRENSNLYISVLKGFRNRHAEEFIKKISK